MFVKKILSLRLMIEYSYWIFLRLLPLKRVVRFAKREKLSSKYIESYEIVERVGLMAYWFFLLKDLSRIHDIFCLYVLQVSSKSIACVEVSKVELRSDLSYEKQPMQIIDRIKLVLRTKTIPFVKVLWRNYKAEKATWGLEKQMQA